MQYFKKHLGPLTAGCAAEYLVESAKGSLLTSATHLLTIKKHFYAVVYHKKQEIFKRLA